jgi:hypothetical protein
MIKILNLTIFIGLRINSLMLSESVSLSVNKMQRDSLKRLLVLRISKISILLSTIRDSLNI